MRVAQSCWLAVALPCCCTYVPRHFNAQLLGSLPAGIVGFVAILALATTTDYDPPWLLRGGYAAVSVVSAVLVASLLLPGPLTRLLAQAPFVAVGQMSYSWYVVHWPVILIMTSDRIGFDGWPLLVAKVVISSVAAAALHLAIEQPLAGQADVNRAVTGRAPIAASAPTCRAEYPRRR